MTDVFISYARADQKLASDLARELRTLGYKLWWDADLLASDDFNDVIFDALTKAKAVIVIWTAASVKSAFVRDEARFALAKDKLISTRTPGLDIYALPFGFQGQHTEELGNTAKIVRAIEKFGVVPSAANSDSDESAAWSRVQASNEPGELIAFLSTHPATPHRAQAEERLRALANRRPVSLQDSNLPPSAAFLSGLRLQMPDFISSLTGNWVAIGIGSALMGLSALLSILIATMGVPAPVAAVAFFGLVAIAAGYVALQRFTAVLKRGLLLGCLFVLIGGASLWLPAAMSIDVAYATLVSGSIDRAWFSLVPYGGVLLIFALAAVRIRNAQ